jgi:Dolichyl-phosphate-mannose-protein mannosyltransferase
MDTATVSSPVPDALSGPDGAPGRRRRRRLPALHRPRTVSLHIPALVLLLIATLALRLWGIKSGLPYSFNSDEATHFVPRAVGFFSHDLNPHYFLNPPGYTYLLYIVFELWFGSADAVMRTYATDPTAVFVVARVVASVLGTVAVWFTYLAGSRFFNRTIGLLAAAIFGLSFLPIFYSHLALNDVPTLAPVALSLYAASGVMRRGRRRDYVLAGLGVGLAAATKYTGGFTAMCLVLAAACDAADGSARSVARRVGLAGLVALAAFVIANPYALIHFSDFASGVSQQASEAAGSDPVKLGTKAGNGIGYYLWTFTWGLGWGPALAAVGGAILLIVRRRLGLVLTLVPVCIAFIVFMGDQQRYFGRWLMPVFPIVSLLAAYAAVELVRWLHRARGVPVLVGGAVAVVLLVGQSLAAVLHNDAVLSRPDTRNLTRAWMVAHVPVGSRVVIEPLVPDNWATDVGRSLPTATGERWWRYATWLTDVDQNLRPLPKGQLRYVVVDQYERVLRPALLNEYVAGGYCWVVLGSLQAGRAFAQPQDAPEAIAYYSLLAERATLEYHISPFAPGAHPVPFSFDWSIDYYPRQYRLPGPEMSVYHLHGGVCGQ